MSSLLYKVFCGIVLICFTQKVTSVNPEIDNESAKSKISDIVGTQQLALRSFLNTVKLERQTFDHDMQSTLENTKKTLNEQTQKILDTLDSDLKTGDQQNQPHCADSVVPEITELSKEALKVHDKCISESKPNTLVLEQDTTKHAEYQTKIGQIPQGCVKTNDDSNTVVKCVETAMDDLVKEINFSQNQINNKLAEIKQAIKNMETLVNNCQQNAINTIQDKAKNIQGHFNTCMTTTKG